MDNAVKRIKPAPAKPSAPVVAWLQFPPWLLAVLLALLTIALYWPAMHHDFVNYDDDVYVTSNVQVQKGLTLENVRWAFINPVDGNWHPVTMLSHELDCQLYGLKPWGHHLTDILLHALNTVLVFLLLQLMTGARWRSALVAALFGAHPLHVESVAWVAERKDVLSTFFGLLALIFYVRHVQKSEVKSQKSESNFLISSPFLRSPFYWLSLFFFALGLMSKPMLVTWPCVMLLLDYWPLRRISDLRFPISDWKRLLLEKVPFFLFSAAASVVTFLVQKRGGAVMTTQAFPMGSRVENALISYGRYLEKLFWPTDLAILYPHVAHWPLMAVAASVLLLYGMTALFFRGRKRYPFLLMGWLWFLGTLVPVIGLVQVGEQSMADRYTYIPSLGVLVLVVWGAHELTKRWQHQETTLALAGSAAIVLCLAVTHKQLGYWQDSEALFQHTLKVTENNELAHNNLGLALLDKGQTDEAISQFQEAIRLNPDAAEIHENLGGALLKRNQDGEAINEFQEGVRLKPASAVAHNDLGNAFFSNGQTDEAMEQFQEAVRLAPDYADARVNLGVAFLRKGQTDEAKSQFEEAIRLRPNDANAHLNLGIALAKKGQVDEAISQFQQTILLKPDDADAHAALGNALFGQGRTSEALGQFQEAIRVSPDDADAHVNLGVGLLNMGRTDEAISQFQEAIRLRPDDANACLNLGVALLKKGQIEEATSQFQEALRLTPNDAYAQRMLTKALDVKRKLDSLASDPAALNNLAWELATSPDASIRNGDLAVKLAERACEATHYRVTVLVGTLAAAYAEAGRFDEAVATGQKACALASTLGETNLLKRNQELVALYQTHQPYHEFIKASFP
jgi:tetratricopeptide (TPR) repeat protein